MREEHGRKHKLEPHIIREWHSSNEDPPSYMVRLLTQYPLQLFIEVGIAIAASKKMIRYCNISFKQGLKYSHLKCQVVTSLLRDMAMLKKFTVELMSQGKDASASTETGVRGYSRAGNDLDRAY